jgi:hypothetical protein
MKNDVFSAESKKDLMDKKGDRMRIDGSSL